MGSSTRRQTQRVGIVSRSPQLRITTAEWKRFLKYIVVDPKTGCYRWVGTKNSNGYGRFRFRGKMWLSHRFSLAVHVGLPTKTKPYGLHDADCPHKDCCNPFHLRWGTQSENLKQWVKARRTRPFEILE